VLLVDFGMELGVILIYLVESLINAVIGHPDPDYSDTGASQDQSI
jgi:hypothetical protein